MRTQAKGVRPAAAGRAMLTVTYAVVCVRCSFRKEVERHIRETFRGYGPHHYLVADYDIFMRSLKYEGWSLDVERSVYFCPNCARIHP